MSALAVEPAVTDPVILEKAVAHLKRANVHLPTLGQLARPATIPRSVRTAVAEIDPDKPDPLNLFRVHWYNAADRRGIADVPGYLLLPEALTGVRAPILVALGEQFPLIHAHKVLAAYGCLVPEIVTGRFDPTNHRALWPSTGNYCRGGVAISRILNCRGVAILPEGMSRERFEWLNQWVSEPGDIVRTPGTESNVKEIFDKCRELRADPRNVIFDQFREYGNYLVHYACTGPALERIVTDVAHTHPDFKLAAFVAATGSAGTLAAGDYLKEQFGSKIVAVEALECPTLLKNGYGEHNIQGIGDKHVPLIHNVMNTDVVVAVSDQATDGLNVVFNSDIGRDYLTRRRGLDTGWAAGHLGCLGLSGIANVLAAIKVAKYFDLSEDEAIITVATDNAALYATEAERTRTRDFANDFDEVVAAETFGRHLLGAGTDNVLELTMRERERIFNLGYFTWVEQQGVPLKDFDVRRSPAFWKGIRDSIGEWDNLIEEFNARTGVTSDFPKR